jgi:glucokinase
VLAVGVDIGGTKISAGVVDTDGTIIDREMRPTPGREGVPADAALTEDLIVDVVSALLERHAVAAVGIGAAGWIAADRATVLFAPHLAWRNEPLRDALRDRLAERGRDLPVLVENDANAAAWAEYRFGAAQGEPVVVCVTLGTGIGGGLVIDGEVYRGAYGIAPEYGHMTIVQDGRICACGNRGCWEMYASGRALARDARELIADSPAAAAAMLMRAGSADDLTGTVVTAAAADGDTAAAAICAATGRWLGRGLSIIASVLDPSVFVIGGGVSAAGDLLVAPAREEFALSLSGRGFRPLARVTAAALGPDAGLIGAADLARTDLAHADVTGAAAKQQ